MSRRTGPETKFRLWFNHGWKRVTETQQQAAERLGARARVSAITVIRAIGGVPIGGVSAVALAKMTRGKVAVGELVRKAA